MTVNEKQTIPTTLQVYWHKKELVPAINNKKIPFIRIAQSKPQPLTVDGSFNYIPVRSITPITSINSRQIGLLDTNSVLQTL